MVSTFTLAVISVNIMFAVLAPCALLLYFKKKYNASVLVFLAGCGIWYIFTMILEQMLHGFILSLPIGGVIRGNVFFNALYGGLTAAVFEETGRFLSMRFLLKRHQGNPHNSLMYGAGHGGFEVFYLFGMSMLSNLTYALMINNGQLEQQMATFSASDQEIIRELTEMLTTTSPVMFAFGMLERLSTLVLQLALSVLVWAAVVNGRKAMLGVAVLLHTFVNFTSIIVFSIEMPTWLCELIVVSMSAAAAWYAKKVFDETVINGTPQYSNVTM